MHSPYGPGALIDDRPDLLDKTIAESGPAKGVKLPASPTVVGDALPSSGSPRQS